MDRYSDFKNELLQIRADVSALLEKASGLPGADSHSFDNWKKTCGDIETQLSYEMIRAAVVGAIKSGKSTFVNSLLRGDYLKRGAGVVTSIVTRIHNGQSLTATLYFKSWDDVNAEIERALVLFPSLNWRSAGQKFDIRNEKERSELFQALTALNADLLIANDARDMNSMLLSLYLKGYEQVKEILSDDPTIRIEKSCPFSDHKAYTGDDALAVYLKDIQLQINAGLDDDIEMADCQGSDSPNPLHLAMIQDYLLRTNLILYVISGRTGLRQADIRFLSIIRNMGILDNILFIVNIDFGEHESLQELEKLLEKITEELSLIKQNPVIYRFSALYNLFRAEKDRLNDRQKSRFEQWERETEFTTYSDQETARFETDLAQKFKKDRYSLLLKNHVERMAVILSGLLHRTRIQQDILSHDSQKAALFAESIRRHQDRVEQVEALIRSTLDGAMDKIKSMLRSDIDRFFDLRYGAVFQEIAAFIKNYSIPSGKYEEYLKGSRFSNALYLLFQEFRLAADSFMAENINPQMARFIREEEKKIAENFAAVSSTYAAMIRDAMTEYNEEMESMGMSLVSHGDFRMPEMSIVRNSIGLAFPPASVAMQYSVSIRTNALMRLGLYSAVKMLKRLFKKKAQYEREEQIRALKYGMTRLKRDTEKSLEFHLKDYRENVKYQYIFRMADAFSDAIFRSLTEHFGGYITDVSKMIGFVHQKQTDKDQMRKLFQKIEAVVENLQQRLQHLKQDIIA